MRGVTVGERYAVGVHIASRKSATVVAKADRRGYWTVEWPDGERETISSHQMVSLWSEHEKVLARYEENMAKRLTWEEYSSGADCPACHRPLQGGRVHLPGLAVRVLRQGLVEQIQGTSWETERGLELALEAGPYMEQGHWGWATTAQGAEALRQHDEDEGWSAHHADDLVLHEPCVRWCVRGGPIHCGFCCPPPPLSPEQMTQIRAILRAAMERQAPRPEAPPEPREPAIRITKEHRSRLAELADAQGKPAEQLLNELLEQGATASSA